MGSKYPSKSCPQSTGTHQLIQATIGLCSSNLGLLALGCSGLPCRLGLPLFPACSSQATSNQLQPQPQLCSGEASVQGMARGCEGRQGFLFFSLGLGVGYGAVLLSQDKVTPPNRAAPLLGIFRSWVPGATILFALLSWWVASFGEKTKFGEFTYSQSPKQGVPFAITPCLSWSWTPIWGNSAF